MKTMYAIALSSLLAFGLLGCEQGSAPGRSNPSAPGDAPKSMQQNGNPSSGSALPPSTGTPSSSAPTPGSDAAGGHADAGTAVPAASLPGQSLADDVVLSNVQTALAAVPGLERSSIDVSVSQGVVTLSGKVSGADQRAQVLQYVSRVQGVQSVVDHLDVA